MNRWRWLMARVNSWPVLFAIWILKRRGIGYIPGDRGQREVQEGVVLDQWIDDLEPRGHERRGGQNDNCQTRGAIMMEALIAGAIVLLCWRLDVNIEALVEAIREPRQCCVPWQQCKKHPVNPEDRP